MPPGYYTGEAEEVAQAGIDRRRLPLKAALRPTDFREALPSQADRAWMAVAERPS